MNIEPNFIHNCRAFSITVPRWFTAVDIYGPHVDAANGIDAIKTAIEDAMCSFNFLFIVTSVTDMDAIYSPNGADHKKIECCVKDAVQCCIEYNLKATCALSAVMHCYSTIKKPEDAIVNFVFYS